MDKKSTTVDEKTVGETVGQRLRDARRPRNQKMFAERLGISPQALSKWENGDIPPQWIVLTRLHDEEGVDLNDLLTKNGR